MIVNCNRWWNFVMKTFNIISFYIFSNLTMSSSKSQVNSNSRNKGKIFMLTFGPTLVSGWNLVCWIFECDFLSFFFFFGKCRTFILEPHEISFLSTPLIISYVFYWLKCFLGTVLCITIVFCWFLFVLFLHLGSFMSLSFPGRANHVSLLCLH